MVQVNHIAIAAQEAVCYLCACGWNLWWFYATCFWIVKSWTDFTYLRRDRPRDQEFQWIIWFSRTSHVNPSSFQTSSQWTSSFTGPVTSGSKVSSMLSNLLTYCHHFFPFKILYCKELSFILDSPISSSSL
jgi:hypothetical protein